MARIFVPLLCCVLLSLLSLFVDVALQDEVVIVVPPAAFNQTNHLKLAAPYTLRLGVIGLANSAVGPTADGVLAIVEYLNNNLTFLPNVAINTYASPYSTADTDNLFDTLYHVKNLQVQGIIGGTTSQQSKDIQEIAKLYSIPQCSPNSISNTLSDKSTYPTFWRTVSSDVSQIGGILTFFENNNWEHGVVIYTTDEYGNGYSALIAQAGLRNITLTAFPASTTAKNYTDYLSVVNTVKQVTDYRIFIIYMTDTSLAQYMVMALNDVGLVGPGYVTILTATTAYTVQDPTAPLYNSPLIDGSFGIGSGLPVGPEYNTILNYWDTLNLTIWNRIYPSPFYAMDCVLTYAHAVDNLMKAGVPFENITTSVLLNQIVNGTFLGTTGNIEFDPQGNRLGHFELYNYRLNQPTVHVGSYDVANQSFVRLGDYVFYGGNTTIPLDSPYKCHMCKFGTCVVGVGCVCNSGYTGNACDVKQDKSTIIIPWLIPLIVVILVSFVGVYFWYRKKRTALVRSVAEKQRSQIARGDLVLHDRIGRGASGEVCKALFRGTEVAVKKIVTSHVSKNVIEEFELEVAIMCGLRHPNIILFMGSCFDPTNQEMLLVMEFMARGSLNDVINNTQVFLSYEMKLSLVCQAAQGMNFLHQSTPPLLHRDLKSHNILIDDKWNARISDFGITKFKEDTKQARNTNANKAGSIGTIYWTAPEVLQGEPNITEKCDCYSFGIVLWEVFHRANPYPGRDPVSVAIEVIRSNLRPPISPDVPDEIQDLIRACWAAKPDDRPTFHVIMTTLRRLMSSRSPITPSEGGGGGRVDAPSGHVYLVATAVEGAYALWEAIPRGMEDAMKLHNQIIRKNLDGYNGYEASCADHSFTAAFSNLEDAVNFSTATQFSLLNAQWPTDLLEQQNGRPVSESGVLLWAGLKVRMSICSGVPNCTIDNATGRMKYFGPVVEKSKQLLGFKQGYILADDEVATGIIKHSGFVHDIATQKIGDVKITTARNKMEHIHKISITALHGRNVSLSHFNASVDSDMPHAVVDVMEVEEYDALSLPSVRSVMLSDAQSVTWVAAKTDFVTKEAIGKGPIGDYFRGSWKGKDVAVKVLVNQRLKEDDILRLVGDSAYMSKINHPNLLPFYAVCLEPNHITILSEYLSRGSLKNILADTSIQISWSLKVKIALEMAQGLSYLTSLPDATFQIHDNLKSNNVLIGKNWEVKVTDFGHGNIRELARTMTSVGNIAWTAPEILNGDTSTPKIAQYSFGIIMWEIYTRQVPYVNEHPIRVVTQILSGFRPTTPADCPAPYKQIIENCLDAEPENRPAWEQIIKVLSSLQ